MKTFLILFATIWLAMTSLAAQAAPGDALKYLPVQEGGRIKPYDSFSREMLEIVYGKASFEGRGASEIVLTWMLSPEAWHDKKVFEVKNHQVLEALHLPLEQRYYTGDELFGNDHFALLRQELQSKRESKEKLTPYFQDLQRLENQYLVFDQLASGRMLRMIPPDKDKGDTWIEVADFDPVAQKSFTEMSQAFINWLGALSRPEDESGMATAGTALDKAVEQFETMARSHNPEAYDHASKINVEVEYNKIHPFRWAYIFYLLTAISLLLMWVLNKPGFIKAAWTFLIVGFACHSFGFAMRMYLMDRPPVSNMYETVIWVSWGVILFAVVLELIYKFRLTLFAGSMVGLVALVIADFAPTVLDPTLQPLEPVLRSNYWLTIHVMTITISYAAFFLAFGLGDLGLFYYLKGEEKYADKIKSVITAIYRSMQIGVMFLAPGIILGGIWADYSWGRFWGWDPKETWALIALLGYLAVLHARAGGMIRGFGMVVTAVISFSLVIMSWYGVNFVLGAGLHSYGFGAGGVEYVTGFIALHLLFVIYVTVVRKERAKKKLHGA